MYLGLDCLATLGGPVQAVALSHPQRCLELRKGGQDRLGVAVLKSSGWQC